ncbi:cwf21 domain-containing protein [Cokeromyces recurvatus]|uniref:cwf21 domain-containing protein n=1 Tax=Cokeromyces recurvatus TaxID=90255 RepID=UPI0022206440|nr:cwf21 domain-containing protein [Cokeromyces recurvatus]KAI7903182.1 cwf21 domain-containing protein [Cokeromyces recurvatus]
MYNGIGLSTPRGSGTNGYVVRNLSFVKPPPKQRDYNTNDIKANPKVKKANAAILDHDRKRKVEVKCMELQIKLEDEGLDEDEIEEKVEDLRKTLLADIEKLEETDNKNLKEYETHQLSAAKEKANEKMKKALKIDQEYVEGSAFDRELQEKLREERKAKREAELEAKLEREEKNQSKRRRH